MKIKSGFELPTGRVPSSAAQLPPALREWNYDHCVEEGNSGTCPMCGSDEVHFGIQDRKKVEGHTVLTPVYQVNECWDCGLKVKELA